MIDFRYHLVSIIAVFLALAIGIVLGSTELQGHTIDVLETTANSLSSQLTAAKAARDSYQTQASVGEQFLLSAEPKLLGGLLAGPPHDSIVIVTEPGAQDSVVSGIKQAAQIAGASVTGEVDLQPKFFDLSGATQSSLSGINNSIAGPYGIVYDPPADQQTEYQQQAAQLIASAILDNPGAANSGASDGLTAAGAQTLLGYYAQAGYLNVSGTPTADRATLVVLVTPQAPPSDGANDPVNLVLLAVAQEFANASAATLVAGSTAGSAQPGSAMSVLRSSSVDSSVSSVDDADTPLGQITVVEALAAQLAGQKPNSYGISGASAVSPASVPSPTVTPSTPASSSPAPNPTATGKGGKPVKNK